jgi:UDP-N-acetylglucosamine 2-epimerase (non-hydrolysing)
MDITTMRKIIVVAGARPNFIKIAPLMTALAELRACTPLLVHTGQHYDAGMSEVFFQELQIPRPLYTLGVGSGSHGEQTARVMLAFEPLLQHERPDWVVVVGDVNSTLACALTAAKQGVPVAHVEAGLRSFDRTMPEEINRQLTDALSELLFTPSEDANTHLHREGIAAAKIHLVGNIMIDTLRRYEMAARARQTCQRYDLATGSYALVTLHRPSNVDERETLQAFLHLLARIHERTPVLFPAHPRTQARLQAWGMALPKGLRLCAPVGYLDFLSLMADARLVLTDSGGVQEETTALGVQCLTLRDTTERPVTVTCGTNRVVGTEPCRILTAVNQVLAAGPIPKRLPPLWDGQTAPRIARLLAEVGGVV